MSTVSIKPWVEVAALHPDVLAEDFSEDIFALDLGPLADGNPNVPAVYRDPEHFFRASYLTKGLRGLLQDVLSRLEGGAGQPRTEADDAVRRRQVAHAGLAAITPPGNRKALDVIPEGSGLPEPGLPCGRPSSTASSSTRPTARRSPARRSAPAPCGVGLPGRSAA